MTATQGNLLAGRFAQLGYVTNDLDSAIASFRDNAGMKNFLRTDGVNLVVGEGKVAHCNVALGVSGGIQFEIIQPTGGDDQVYSDALTGEGFELRLHHHCHWVDTQEEFDAVKAQMRHAGFPIVIEGSDPAAQYFYADMRPVVGHYVEYILFNPDAVDALMAAIPVN
ncbi:MAG TPA: VOC family protein [Sphingobium sp.]|nr:VOC family protein [Sphingobium sp.]